MRGVVVLALVALATGPALADPVEDVFRRGCEERERPELRSGATWPWIEQLCARDAAERAALFRSADHRGRLEILAEDCTDWYARNGWWLPEELRRDARRRRACVEAACRGEAEERLRNMSP
ncbi:hypothetical protein [Benzoatithermus flavus]|uniref:Uncharacterized protein n=1 Tax=Benzoatithermus flavus TaxID=3108223 RepID=A0ABU8XLN5_9PROT